MKYCITDITANTGKIYIGEDGENVELVENAKLFDSYEEACKFVNSISSNDTSWAFVWELEEEEEEQ